MDSTMMPFAMRFAAVLAVAVFAPAGTAFAKTDAAPQQFPIRDFFSNPEKAYFRLNEDGTTLSFMQPVDVGDGKRRLNVFVQPLDGSRPTGDARKITNETLRDISTYYWKGAGRVLYEKDFGGDENTHVVAVDVESGKVTDLTPGEKIRSRIIDDLPDDPHHVILQHNRRKPEVFDLFRVDLRDGKETLIAQNPGDVTGWSTDHAGRLRLATRPVGLQTIIGHRAGDEGEFTPIITTDYKTDVTPQFFTADNTKFYAISNRGRDKNALVLIDPTKPDVEEVLFVHDDVDTAGAYWSRALKKLTHVEYVAARSERKFFDKRYEKLYAALAKKLPGQDIILQANDKAEGKFIVAATDDRSSGTRYIYDAEANTLSKLADLDKIPADQLSPMKPIAYQSRDGLTIHGYLTLPVGREPKKLACIVNPHGGPWARDQWGYNPEVQFLANRGYCVLQVNFRGSTGYGRRFWEASFGQWGLKMQDDVSDGVQWLIDQGYADPKRIGIYGGSYGGYTTLAGVTFTPDLYAAAVDYVGVSNLFTFMETIPAYWLPYLPQLHAMVGHPERDKERLTATSPALHADKIKTPLFIAQGANDARVKISESDQMVNALKARGVDVQYMVKDDEGHGFRSEENQYEFYGAMEAFLEKHLKPNAPPSGP